MRAVHLPEKPTISLLRKIQGARLSRELDPVSNDLFDKGGPMLISLLAGLFSNDLAIDLGTANTLV
ncbi:MAG TPA: hypothetical protein VK746_11710, partial [Candidatus Eisenbacteria bacterium]|nr:hypothetical protein [Candidatus Eisenbacteria bacterium]